jgi:hypothetical protein
MARTVQVSIPHSLGQQEARRRIELGFNRLEQQMTGGMGAALGLRQRWEADKLCFEGGALGQKVSGRIEAMADAVHIELDLPELLAGLAERIGGRLEQEGQKLLAKGE